MAKRAAAGRRRPSVQITLGRASRLHRFVMSLAAAPRTRAELLAELGIGLRTFYRELELLKRCAVRVRLVAKAYVLQSTPAEAEGQLPFPDPLLSFAEMAELSRGPGEAARRLAGLLASVVAPPGPKPVKGRGPRKGKTGPK